MKKIHVKVISSIGLIALMINAIFTVSYLEPINRVIYVISFSIVAFTLATFFHAKKFE